MRGFILGCFFIALASFTFAQSKSNPIDKFKQLEEILPTPNDYRTAYKIDVELDDVNQRISGTETITYYNNSQATKLIVSKKEIKSLTLDPHLETADADLSNNYFPRRLVKSRFQIFKDQQQSEPNPMQLQERKPGETRTKPNPQQQ